MKVAVIGAGINGLYISRKLSNLGNEVVVFEKKPEAGNDVCSGLFSNRILEYFKEKKKLIEKKITSVVIHFKNKDTRVKFSKEFLLMSHYELDKLAYELALKAGVKFNFNCDVKELPGYDRIIGCDGANSIVRKKLKLEEPEYRLGIIAYRNLVPVETGTKFLSEDTVEVWPVSNGFLWKIPRKNNTEYGVIAKPVEAGKLFNEFKKDVKDLKSKIIPQGLIIPDNERITLCGDAAGLTKPWSGGGVIWGMIAGDMLVNNFPDFKKYKREAEGFFKKKIFISKLAVKAVDKFSWLAPRNAKIESDFLI